LTVAPVAQWIRAAASGAVRASSSLARGTLILSLKMDTKRAFSGAPWESKIGYCRAIRVGEHIYVSGTAPVGDDGKTFAPHLAYEQAKRCLEIIERALKELEADRRSIVRTHMFVTDVRAWSEFGRAHKEFFGDQGPATSMVEVKSLIDPAMMIEIEADAICRQ
jgi:enamine deaminase RidA (YjgF/YER057c/UK114 family)